MSTLTVASAERTIAIALTDLPANVRSIDEAHVRNLAGSIKLRGLIIPLVVRPVGERFELVAGFHRYRACREAGLSEVPVVVREQEGESADRAAENVLRKQLTRWRRRVVDGMAASDVGQPRAAWPRANVTAAHPSRAPPKMPSR